LEIRRIINKACHVDAAQRFQTASAFMAKIHEVRPSVPDWRVIEGCPTLIAKTSLPSAPALASLSARPFHF
jgi:hypothetical protein